MAAFASTGGDPSATFSYHGDRRVLVYYATCVLLIRTGGWPFPLFYCAFIQRVLIILSDNHSGPERVPVQVPLLVCVALHWAVDLTLTPYMLVPYSWRFTQTWDGIVEVRCILTQDLLTP